MPYDTILYGEATQNNGLAGVAGLGPSPYAYTGDTVTLKDEDRPFLHRFGGISDTKPAATALIPTNSNSNKGWYGPASLTLFPLGIADFQDFPIELMKGDIITGQINNTNVNEGSVVFADISYGAPIPRWSLASFAGRGKPYLELATVTSTADVTYNSGVVTIYSACTNTLDWWDSNGEYYILGVMGSTGVASAGGVLNVTNVGGNWKGMVPGIPMNTLSDVHFSTAQPFTAALEPIGPISGSAMKNSASVGLTSTTAGAQTFVLVIARTK